MLNAKTVARILGSFRALFPESFLSVWGEILIQYEDCSCLLAQPVPSNFHTNSLIAKTSVWAQLFPGTAQSFTKYGIRRSRRVFLALIQLLLRFYAVFLLFQWELIQVLLIWFPSDRISESLSHRENRRSSRHEATHLKQRRALWLLNLQIRGQWALSLCQNFMHAAAPDCIYNPQ